MMEANHALGVASIRIELRSPPVTLQGDKLGWSGTKQVPVRSGTIPCRAGNSEGAGRTGDGSRSTVGQTLKAMTLRVPVGWNKPTSCCGRSFCREVGKTCGRNAVCLEAHLSRRAMMALKGTKPGEMPVVLPVKGFVRNLEVG